MGVTIAGRFGEPAPEPPEGAERPEPQLRKMILTPASEIKVRRVRWIWKDRVALGTLALLAGREGLGKSTLAYDIAARVTRGTLDGENLGTPRGVLICAAEDSWEHTIVPRLIAAGADLERIFRVEIETYDDMLVGLSLPRDFKAVEEAAELVDAGLMVLDPLMSVIDTRLDTHKDREVRAALDPLSRLADRARMAIIGLIHHNKSGSTDALQLVMGSKAFSAVARSVHTCIPDPDDETQTRRLFATSKNNLGRLDLPVLGFTITSHAVETEDDGTAWTGRMNWTGEVAGSMTEIMTRSADPERSATAEAAEWLYDYLTSHGGEAAKTEIEKAGRIAGHPATVLRRARERLRLEHRSWGFPRQTLWALPNTVAKPTTDQGENTDQPVDITEPRCSPGDLTDQADTPLDLPTNQASDQAGPDDATASRVNGDDATADRIHSRVTSENTTAVVPVASEVDATVTQLGLTSENASHAGARAYAGGDTPTDMTDSLTPLENPPVVSVASVVSRPTHAPAREAEPYAIVAGSDPTIHGEPWTPAFPGQRPPFQPGNRAGIASDWTPAPDLDLPAPTCLDCGWPIDTTQHDQTCEEAP
jgi:AAA domain-containing protein